MAIKLTIKKPSATESVSIDISVSEAKQPIEFKNSAMIGVLNMEDAIAPSLPFLTYSAIESACISGMIYARRKLGLNGLHIELLSFSCSGKVENAEPFAVAIMIAACKAFSKPVTFSESELNGWSETALPN
jgi:hypothetical protein